MRRHVMWWKMLVWEEEIRSCNALMADRERARGDSKGFLSLGNRGRPRQDDRRLVVDAHRLEMDVMAERWEGAVMNPVGSKAFLT